MIALLVALVISPGTEAVDQLKLAQFDLKKCPYCSELIKHEAKVCRYRGREIQPLE